MLMFPMGVIKDLPRCRRACALMANITQFNETVAPPSIPTERRDEQDRLENEKKKANIFKRS